MSERVLALLHGGGPGVDAASNWTTVYPRLSERFTCLAPDLLGFGAQLRTTAGAEWPRGPRAWARARARQVLALLDKEGVDRVDVIGNSAAGGAAALALAAMAPHRVRRAVVMGGAGTGPLPTRVPFYEDPTRESMHNTLTHLLSETEANSGLVDKLTSLRLERAIRPGAEAAFRSMLEPDPSGTVPIDPGVVAVPVLALHGEEDQVVPVQVSRDLAAALPKARLEVVNGAGHWIHIDRPDVFCTLVEEFVAV